MSSDVCKAAAKAGLREEAGGSHVNPKELQTVVSRGTAPPGGGDEAEPVLFSVSGLPLGADVWSDGQAVLGQQASPLTCLRRCHQRG